ncbi:hypothetical protein [Pseudoalteromonas luteoviolacea]|uniref:Filamentous haemagglutinin FhaB/tRNA nuclease CdiA-like TPS domain-containing protein n=1 Tax=Pseudoalteromonas luteoviolacea S4054 TaxID=1129367 RepID=A0A0F6A7V4_9GAMM|nr:hypothetical protein [Pseudoalteromonas luteoviolacea]AOT11061.1 hypothetical protein S4054249_24820 [Pseudoalteromonas luteoviolacea]AOT15775.1 hypothetical protein S40542_23690 [Pseudoalteromonas luteoviolacea]AOT20882.1 hypothetical protein S4054_24740 [Pseudoalteromonas luteoviolacea]KKE81921.1 hypothetical protein N479_20715 [Pseudoalteromonas luteoviolacea S4054]KZN71100.1 hypothetical protein N481_19670 [Pseudoalteromonas luteoviolacea S4047-1]
MNYIFFFLVSFFSAFSFSGEFKSSADSRSNVDLYIPSKPNSSGVSNNDVSSYSVSSSNIKVLNYASNNGGRKASRIIINVSSSSLKRKISLVGESAELIILAKNFSCTGCKFEGFDRVIIAGGINGSDLTASENISINSLDASGVPVVTLLGEKVTLAGNINTHDKVERAYNGQYVVLNNGSQKAGVGTFAAYAGRVTLNIDSLSPTTSRVSNDLGYELTTNNNLKITANAVKLISNTGSGLKINGVIDTTSDVFMTGSLGNKIQLASEGLVASNLCTSLFCYIQYTGQVNTGGSVISSGYSLSLDAKSTISADKVQMTSRHFTNMGGIFTDNFGASTVSHFSNEGQIHTRFGRIESNNYIQNSGSIFGKDLHFYGKNRFRNGNAMPKVIGHRMDELFLEDLFYGTYTRVLERDSGQINNPAIVHASNLYISTKGFENINSYYVSRGANDSTWTEKIPLDLEKSNQVVVAAEHNLHINAEDYFLNSSANVLLNSYSSSGTLYIESKKVINERYRMESDFSVQERVVNNTREKHVLPNFLHYSSPGQIRSIGKFKVKSSEFFLNDSSFVEVFGEMEVNTPKLYNYGLQVTKELVMSEGLEQFEQYARCTSIDDYIWVNGRRVPAQDYCSGILEEADTTVVSVDVKEIDTLFYAGMGVLSTSDFEADNRHLSQNIQNYILQRYKKDIAKVAPEVPTHSECSGGLLDPTLDLSTGNVRIIHSYFCAAPATNEGIERFVEEWNADYIELAEKYK